MIVATAGPRRFGRGLFLFHWHRANLMTVEELEAMTADQPMTAWQAAIILLRCICLLLAQNGHGNSYVLMRSAFDCRHRLHLPFAPLGRAYQIIEMKRRDLAR
jgi:hypothetical protein